MFWHLDRQFALKTRIFAHQILIYHQGSGMTHCLSGDAFHLFEFFLRQPDLKFNEEDIQLQCPNIDKLKSLLQELKSMYLLKVSRSV